MAMLVKPGVHSLWPCTWFHEIVLAHVLVCLCVCVSVCVCVCVSPPPRLLITSHVKGTCNNRIIKIYGYSISLYDTAVDKLNRHGLSNTAGRERLPKKSQVMHTSYRRTTRQHQQVGVFQL